MKITIVTGFFLPVPPLRGGSTEKIWYRLSREFAARGHSVTVISRAWPSLADRAQEDGVDHIRLSGFDHRRSLVANLWHDFRWGIRVTRQLPDADVVICNTVTLPVWLRFFRPAAGRVVAVMARMPKGHGVAYRQVDLLLSLSDAVSDRLCRENPRLRGRIAPFPYPIDWHLHARAAAARRAPHCVTLGFVGRLHPEKGLMLLAHAVRLLAAMTDLPEWRIRLVGPHTVPEGGGGPDFVEAWRREAGVPAQARVTIQGPEFNAEALAREYAAIDVFCYPSTSEHGETFGVAVAEAMAAGCAPIVSDLACFRTLVLPDSTGLVFDHRAADAPVRLARGLAALLRDGAARQRLAQAAQAHVKQFDFAASADSVLASLQRIVAA